MDRDLKALIQSRLDDMDSSQTESPEELEIRKSIFLDDIYYRTTSGHRKDRMCKDAYPISVAFDGYKRSKRGKIVIQARAICDVCADDISINSRDLIWRNWQPRRT